MPTSGEPMRRHFDVRRAVAWVALVVTVAAGHLSLPWLLEFSLRRVTLVNPGPAETIALQTRRVVPEPATLPPSPPPPAKAQNGEPPPLPPVSRTPVSPGRTEDASRPPAEEALPAPSVAPLDDTSGDSAVLYTVSGQFGGRTVAGNATLQWKIDPNAYVISLQVTASHQFTSVFAWQLKTQGTADRDGMRPETYDEGRVVSGEGQQSRSVQFESEPTPDSTAGPRVDPLSGLLKLSSDLHLRDGGDATQGTGPSPHSYSIVVRIGDRSLHLNFRQQGEEELSTPFGPLRTEKFVTEYPNPFHDNPQVTLWLAPAFRHAPARVRLEQPEVAVLSFDLASEPVAFPDWR